jgi:hypothetical protein
VFEVSEVCFLAGAPGRLRRLICICAPLNDRHDSGTESSPDLSEATWPALILDSVVQKRRDRLRRGTPVLKHQTGDAKQMSYIRHSRAFAALVGVPSSGAVQRLLEFALHGHRLTVFVTIARGTCHLKHEGMIETVALLGSAVRLVMLLEGKGCVVVTAGLSLGTEEERRWADLATRRLFDEPVAEVANSIASVGTPLTEKVFDAMVLVGRGIDAMNRSMPEDVIRTAILTAKVMQRADQAMQRAESGGPMITPIAGKKITEVDLVREDRKGEYRRLTVRIDETGSIVFEGQDVGHSVEAQWGDSDYEYWITIDQEYVITTLLHLLQDKFDNSTLLKMWLEDNDIPYRFWSY